MQTAVLPTPAYCNLIDACCGALCCGVASSEMPGMMAVSTKAERARTVETSALLAMRLRWAVASSGVLAPVSALFLLGALPIFPSG